MGLVGGFILNVVRETTRIYATAVIASWIISKNQKEGIMRPVYDARSLNLSHLNPVSVSYHPKSIHTEAIQVTPDNIGKLSLEFEEELFYEHDGRPYFVFSAKRFDANEPDGQQAPNELYVRLTDWIVPLWDELHIFRNAIFQATFDFDEPMPGLHSAPVSLARPFVTDEPIVGQLSGPSGTGIMPRTEGE